MSPSKQLAMARKRQVKKEIRWLSHRPQAADAMSRPMTSGPSCATAHAGYASTKSKWRAPDLASRALDPVAGGVDPRISHQGNQHQETW